MDENSQMLLRLLAAAVKQTGELRLDADQVNAVGSDTKLLCRKDQKTNEWVLNLGASEALIYKMAAQAPSQTYSRPIQNGTIQRSKRMDDEAMAQFQQEQVTRKALRQAETTSVPAPTHPLPPSMR